MGIHDIVTMCDVGGRFRDVRHVTSAVKPGQNTVLSFT